LPPITELQYNAPSFFLLDAKEESIMKQLLAGTGIVGGVVLATSQAVANAPAGGGAPDYSGISGMYYALIGLILAYGVYDTFFKKS
jgi:hypothetical protein